MKFIEINKAKQNNLKDLSLKIPLGSFTLICGLSGSGKSSLAFETLYAEGQRRYLQNLSNYLKQYIIKQNPPEVESINNLPPALALGQTNNIKSSRSTVAGLSGLADLLRLIFEKTALIHCPKHHLQLESFTVDKSTERLLKDFKGERVFILAPIEGGKIPAAALFLKKLRQKGWRRLLFPTAKGKIFLNQMKNVEDVKRLPKRRFYILIDRFVAENRYKDRIRDSFKQAFELSKMFSLANKENSEEALAQTTTGALKAFSKQSRCPQCGYEFPLPLSSALFNSNSPLGACKACEGYGCILQLDEELVIPRPRLSLLDGAVHPFENPSAQFWKEDLLEYCAKKKIPVEKPYCDLTPRQRQSIWKGGGPFGGIEGYFKNLERKRYKMHIRILLSRYKSSFPCKTCQGLRLRTDLDSILFHGKSFNDCMKMSLGEMKSFFEQQSFSPKEKETGFEAFSALNRHLQYLNTVGLSYLQLNRSASSLSGGEFQRLNLSRQLGLCLSQVLYVLDEPTVGLHPRDTDLLIELLKELNRAGNTIVVVEHDQDMMQNCNYIIEMGPKSGKNGGEVLWSGPAEKFLSEGENSNTAPYLRRKNIPFKTVRPVDREKCRWRLLLKNCKGHNLKNVDLFVPLNRFVVMTGVSGSGKSSLACKTLYPALRQKLFNESPVTLPFNSLEGAEFLKSVILMTPYDMGRSSRSSVISYIKAFEFIRHIFANTPLTKRMGFTASHFSLNVEGGRCPFCKGSGYQEIDMVFMDSIKISCDECHGKKFKKEVLKIKFKEKNIHEVLHFTVAEAFNFFKREAALLRAFTSLKEVGLGYLTLGQSINSLSGGERQRLKLSRELLNSRQEKTLYILDEPTKGLHFKEVEILLKVIDRLVDTGGCVLAVEHNLDFIKAADFVIDVGPSAGEKGGQITAEGTPQQLIQCPNSWTGLYLKKFMEGGGPELYSKTP